MSANVTVLTGTVFVYLAKSVHLGKVAMDWLEHAARHGTHAGKGLTERRDTEFHRFNHRRSLLCNARSIPSSCVSLRASVSVEGPANCEPLVMPVGDNEPIDCVDPDVTTLQISSVLFEIHAGSQSSSLRVTVEQLLRLHGCHRFPRSK